MQSNYIINSKVRYALTLVVLLIILFVVYNYLTHGRLTVTTNQQNSTIQLQKVKGTSLTNVKSSTEKLSASLTAGQYIITVINKSASISQRVSIKARASKSIEIKIPSQYASQSVLPYNVLSLATNSSTMYYLDYDSSNLFSIGSNGISNDISSGVVFNSIKWQNSSFGIGQANNNQLYSIINGQIALLSVPFSYNSQSVDYSISNNGTIYVSQGSTVYASEGLSGFHKFFTTSSDDPQLFAGHSHLAIIDPYNEYSDRLIIVNQSTGSKIVKNINASTIYWSPNDQYLVVSGGGNTSVNIYNPSLNIVDILAQNINGLAWQDDNTLYYGESQNLWRFSINNGDSRVYSSTPALENISSVYYNSPYIYFSAQSSTNSSDNIFLKVGVTPQANQVPSYYSGLSVLLPTSTDNCSFSYSNFLQLYILVDSPTNPQACEGATKAVLNSFGLPSSQFNLQYITTGD